MKTKKLSVPLVGIGLENLRPNVAELTEPLVERGFRSLANSTPSDLPVGSLALLYNSKSGTMNFILIQKHVIWNNQYIGINFLPHGKLMTNNPEKDSKYLSDFKFLYFKVIAHVEIINSIPQVEQLPNVLKEVGFEPLADATSEKLPTGSLVFLYKAGSISPIIVRKWSDRFDNDHRLLFWRQSHITTGNWDEAVLMEHLTPFENYSYCVF